jgi:methanogen homoisocitrate dehydrogenase
MKLGVIEGDGVGREVIPAALQILDCFPISFEKIPVEVGYDRWEKTGQAISENDIEVLKECDCILFGAVTSPADPNYKSVLLTIRKELDLYANIRPIHPIKGIRGINDSKDFDILIVRENTEGMYSGIEKIGPEEAYTKRVITKHCSMRIAEIACKFAKKRKQNLTIVHKSNVLKSDTLFLDTCRQVADSMNVECNDMLVDAMAYDMIRFPGKYGVVVATNLFGDILSDMGAALVGSLGLVPSANIGLKQALFEPVHGSAPDIAGKGIANPIAAILSVKMLLSWIGEEEAARRVEKAVEKVILNGVKTPDLGGNATTKELTREIARILHSMN